MIYFRQNSRLQWNNCKKFWLKWLNWSRMLPHGTLESADNPDLATGQKIITTSCSFILNKLNFVGRGVQRTQNFQDLAHGLKRLMALKQGRQKRYGRYGHSLTKISYILLEINHILFKNNKHYRFKWMAIPIAKSFRRCCRIGLQYP